MRGSVPVLGVLVLLAAAAPAFATDDLPIAGVAEDEGAAIRRPYDEARWRIEFMLGAWTGMWAFQYRAWPHSGLGIGLVGVEPDGARQDDDGLGDRLHNAVTLQAWTERTLRLMPGAAGLRFQAGPMSSEYLVAMGDTVVASATGAVAEATGYLLLPLFSVLADRPRSAWWPNLVLEMGLLYEWDGRMKTRLDVDLDHDGAVDHVKGQVFRDSRWHRAKVLPVVMPRAGVIWLF
jgi:hypothetical protein